MTTQRQKPKRKPLRLRVWQRLLIALFLLALLGLSSTLFTNFARLRESAESEPTPGVSGWEDSVYAYVLADEGEVTAPFYNDGLAVSDRCGRGTYIEMQSWEPFRSESGKEFYRVYWNGRYGYLLCDNITDDRSDVLQETQVYVRTSVNLLTRPEGTELGALAEKGELLRIVGYDYFNPNGEVNMYEVKLGAEIGWIRAGYVAPSYAEAQEHWDNDEGVYAQHVKRGDKYGGGDAAQLDYWPHEKGDFSEAGNVMPQSCYSLYVSADRSTPEDVDHLLQMAQGTAINTFVFTIHDDKDLCYPSTVLGSYGLLDDYDIYGTLEDFAQSVKKVQDAGYYTVARITTFKDAALAKAYPQWSITDLAGSPLQLNESYWPSVYSRDVWKLKIDLALEVVDTFGFNEIQFDYVRFPDYMLHYEQTGNVDLKNTYNESRAQAVQRFLIYATDILHNHGVYVGADVFGETSNDYVAPYGQYWVAISTVVDVISGMPYPDHYDGYTRGGVYYRPYQHPYATLYDWAEHVAVRQSECSSPAIVRTWIQTWDDPLYIYDEYAIEREIVALYDMDITGGYMPWYGYGSYAVRENLGSVIRRDYYDLYLKAEAEGVKLSEHLNIDTENE